MAWDDIVSSYDVVSEAYEQHFLHELDDKPFDRALLSSFASAVRDPVVDVGCGPGQVGLFLRQRGRGVIGLDLSANMARLAASRLDASVRADTRSLPFRSDVLGGIVAFYSLIHLRRDELAPALREFHRVTLRGGRVLFSVHEGHGEHRQDEFLGTRTRFSATLFQTSELIEATEDAGFADIEPRERQPYEMEHQTVRLYLSAVKP